MESESRVDSCSITLADVSKIIVDEGPCSGKVVSVTSWQQNTPDRRALKGTARTRLANGDVYPHEAAQDEDSLNSEKVRKGFLTGPIAHEHASLNGGIDRDDANKRAALLYLQINQKKGDTNLLSGKKTKDSVSQLPVASPPKEKDIRTQWYQNLAKGKAYGSLIQNPPSLKNTERMFNDLYYYRIESQRAMWVMKLAANIAGNNNSRGKNKSFNGEKFAVEYAHILSREVRQVFVSLFQLPSLDECEETSEKWYYFTQLSRDAFDDGVIDRQEYVNELCNIFTDVFLQRKEFEDTKYQIQLWMQYFHHFAPSATQNIVLARRVATMACQKIDMLKDEFEEDEAELLDEIRNGTYDYSYVPSRDDEAPSTSKSPSQTHEPMDLSREIKKEEPDQESPMTSGTTPGKADGGSVNDVVMGEETAERKNVVEIVTGKVKEEPLDDDEEPPKLPVSEEAKKDDGKKDGEKKKGIPYDPERPDKFILDVMFATRDYRDVLNALVSLIFMCIGEQPGAIVWNNFYVGFNRAPYMLTQLGGSPLDYLDNYSLADLPFDFGNADANENVRELMRNHESDLSLRSELVQHQWVLTSQTQRAHAKLIDGCIDVVGYLDYVDVLAPGTVKRTFERIFMSINEARYAHEVVSRIRLCLTWAITVQRDGQWRGWLVAKVLKLLLDTRPHDETHGYFGGNHLNLILIDFINHDLPKSGEENYYKEFSNFCSLFFELARFDVITHANFYEMWKNFHRINCRHNGLDEEQPLMIDFPPVRDDEVGKKKEADTSAGSDENRPHEVDNTKMEVDGEGNAVKIEVIGLKELELEPKKSLIPFITIPDETKDGFRLLDEDIPPLTQLIIQLPIPADKTMMDKRTLILYRNARTKKDYVAAAKKVATDIIDIMRDKMSYRWKGNDVAFSRRVTSEVLKELLQRMRLHTLFDRQQIANWVADGFSNSIGLFLENKRSQLPTFEALDFVCTLYEQTNNIHEFFEFAELILSKRVPHIETAIRHCNSIIIPGLVSAQYTYVFCSYLVKHLQYFVHYERAPKVVDLLYLALEQSLKAVDYPRNGFGRAAAAAVYHLRDQLIESEVVESTDMLGGDKEFAHIFDQGTVASEGSSKYNRHFMMDNFQLLIAPASLRIYDYHDFKKRLPSFADPINRYSFVVNAFVAASKLQRDFDRLNDLASFCSHWTAHHPEMANDWMGAMKSLCNAKSNYGFKHLLEQVEVSDCSIHYSLSTFASLLASKYAFSVPQMICEISNSTFANVLKKETAKASSRNSYKNDYESEPSACIALLFLTQVCCASDDPFILSDHFRGRAPTKKLLECSSTDFNILAIVHWCEMNDVVWKMIVRLGIMNDTLQSRVRDHNLQLEVPEGEEPSRRDYKKEYLPVILRQVLISITEQDWVKDRMWKVSAQDDMAAYGEEQRLKQNCLGQQLLRLGTRRRCERETLAQLAVCNGNSKRALIDKLFSALNIWNFRATLFDLRLMIKEMSPDGSSKHAQQGAIAADALMGEIAKCARELYVQAFRQNKIIMKKDERFSFSSLTNYLLLPTLIDDCPTPANMPSSFSASFKSKFLAECCTMLDVGPEPSEDKIKMSAWLIQDRSFLNVIMACMKGTDREDQAAKENLMSQILKQIQDLAKIKEDDMLTSQEERIDIFLRLQLVGYVFKQVLKKDTAEAWALVLFQLMLRGVITPTRNLQMYNTTFDMLSSIIIWSLTDEGTVQPATDKNEKADKSITSAEKRDEKKEEAKYRFPYYMQIVRKFRKELVDTKTTMETRHLHAFLPLPKAFQQLLPLEPFRAPQGNSGKSQRKQTNVGLRRGRPCVQVKKSVDRIKISAFENLQGYNPDHTTRKFPSLNFYMPIRLDMSMTHPYRVVERLIGHSHPAKGFVNNPLQLEGELNGFFLDPVHMEDVGEPPWVVKNKSNKKRRRGPNGESETDSDYEVDVKETVDDDKDDDEEAKEKDDKDDGRSSVATPAALARGDMGMNIKQEPKLNIKEEDIVVLDSPLKTIKAETNPTPTKESELAKIMSQPFQATPSYPGVGPMGAGGMGAGPMGAGHMGPMGSGPMGGGPMGGGPMGTGPMGQMGPGAMGGGPMGGPMGPGSMGPGAMGPGAMGPGGVAPAPIKATRRKSTPKEPAEKKERKRPTKRNSAGLTLQTTMTPPMMNTPPKGGVPLTHPSQLQQPGMLQLSQPPDWPPQGPSHGAPPTMQQDHMAPPRDTATGPATTLSQLMGHHQPPQQQQQPQQMTQMQQQQLHMQQQQRQQQQQQQGSSQQIMMQHLQAQQAQKEAQMKQEQAMKQDHFDSSDATAKSKLHDMVMKRQDEKAARTHGMPPDYVTPDKSQAGGPQKRVSPELAAQMHQQPQQQQQYPQQQPGPGMMQQQPTGPGQMGQPGMMQRQPDHKQTNHILANHIKNQQLAAQAAHASAAQSQQQQQLPGGSTQQPGMQQTPSYPQQPQQQPQHMQQQQQHPGAEMHPSQQQQRGGPLPGQPQRPPLTIEEQRRMREMEMQRQQQQQQQQFLTQQQQQQMQQAQGMHHDVVGGPGGPQQSKMPPMGSGAVPYPNRPAAPALNQSTNQPPQQQQSQLGAPPNYQAYQTQQQPQQQLPQYTPAQMEEMKRRQMTPQQGAQLMKQQQARIQAHQAQQAAAAQAQAQAQGIPQGIHPGMHPQQQQQPTSAAQQAHQQQMFYQQQQQQQRAMAQQRYQQGMQDPNQMDPRQQPHPQAQQYNQRQYQQQPPQ